LNPDERRDLIKQYRAGHAGVVDALKGITEQELDKTAADDPWTARMVVHHLADSEMTAAIRLRRLIAEDNPVIPGYDEMEFARVLYYADRPIEGSLDMFRLARETTAQILDRLTDTQWERTGTHTESGPYSVKDWLVIYASHGHDHANQIRRLRGLAAQ
jgi:DinB superfamily